MSSKKNILYCTQSNSLSMFSDLHKELSNKIDFKNICFTVADHENYLSWISDNPDFEENKFVLKEWEITKRKDKVSDLSELKDFEQKLGISPGIFGGLVADRRLIMGKKSSISQDYSRRFNDDELMSILLESLREVEDIFKKYKPDILISFISVTLLDYLCYLFARSKGIKILNLRPTRIDDRVIFSNTLNDPDRFVSHYYEEYLKGKRNNSLETSKKYISRVIETNSLYEGVVKPSDVTAMSSSFFKALNPIKIFTFIRKVIRNYINDVYKDNHVINPFTNFFYTSILNPIKARIIRFYLRKSYLEEVDFENKKFIFFPLHTEPEVSLLVYGRPFINQIELIRIIALSMPIDMNLYVKEHPWMLGKRSLKAYKKILEIPRVKLISPSIDSRRIVNKSFLVSVITGSIALEAAILGKPVITFGDCPYNLLPDTAVRRVKDLRKLHSTIFNLTKDFKYDSNSIEAFVAANYDASESINLYSSLLKKDGVHSIRKEDYLDEITRLAKYALQVLKRDNEFIVVSDDVSDW